MLTRLVMRSSLGLDGTWEFWPEKARRLTGEPLRPRFVSARERTAALGEPRRIEVPGVWQAQFEDLRMFSGIAWYERRLVVPASWRERALRLRFGAVDYFCTVWINGREAGRHEGGYLPFDLDVGRLVAYGEASIVTLCVLDVGPGDNAPIPFDEIPHGKQRVGTGPLEECGRACG